MTARPWSSIPPARHDVRMVVCDMDGTLLDGRRRIPDEFWPLLKRLHDGGIVFVPASGRQYATLEQMFARSTAPMSFIAENGNLVVHGGESLTTAGLGQATVHEVIDTTRQASGRDLGLVVCGRHSAYVERQDPAFLREVETYYADLEITDDLTEVNDDVLKLAVFDFAGAERTAGDLFAGCARHHQVVVSGEHWIDIMDPGVNKGLAVRSLQETLSVTPAQTVVFGDYLNDLEMLDAAELSFAMGNAHPEVRERARYLAPTNAEAGVVTALAHLLGP